MENRTQEELAIAAKVCIKTIYNKIKEGKIKVIKFGRLVRIPQAEFDRVLREGF